MCDVAGWMQSQKLVLEDRLRSEAHSAVSRILGSQHHRGPDSWGLWMRASKWRLYRGSRLMMKTKSSRQCSLELNLTCLTAGVAIFESKKLGR